MTVLVDENQKKGALGKAVSATLAGALAVGMVPAAALTAFAADADDEAGIDLLITTDAEAIQQGTLSFSNGEASGNTFTANGQPQGITPTGVVPFGATQATPLADVIAANTGADVYYFQIAAANAASNTYTATTFTAGGKTLNAVNNTVSTTKPTAAGNYAVVLATSSTTAATNTQVYTATVDGTSWYNDRASGTVNVTPTSAGYVSAAAAANPSTITDADVIANADTTHDTQIYSYTINGTKTYVAANTPINATVTFTPVSEYWETANKPASFPTSTKGTTVGTSGGTTTLTPVVTAASTFTINSAAMSGLSVYEVQGTAAAPTTANPSDTSDQTITYNGSNLAFGNGTVGNLNLAIDGTALAPADYQISVYDANETLVYQKSGAPAATTDNLKWAGAYTAIVNGLGTYAGQQATFTFNVSPFSLADAVITVAPKAVPTTGAVSVSLSDLTINDTPATTLLANLGVYDGTAGTGFDYTRITGTTAATKAGAFPITLALNIPASQADLAKSVTGPGAATLNVVDSLANPDFKYGTDDISADTGSAVTVATDYSKPANSQNVFDPSKITVTSPDGTALTASQYKLTYFDVTNNKECTASDLLNKGTYRVTVEVIPSAVDFAFAGASKAINVTVTYGNVASSAIAFSQDGKLLAAGAKVTYTGNPIAVTTTVKDGQGNILTAGTDYKVAIKQTKDSMGKTVSNDVTEIVDAGTYTLTVTSDKYTLPDAPNNTLTLTVDPINAVVYRVAGTATIGTTANALFYTGSDIVPTIQYAAVDTAAAKYQNSDGDFDPAMIPSSEWKTLPADTYTIKNIKLTANGETKNVTGIKDGGSYTFDVVDNAGGNYTFNAGSEPNASDAVSVNVYSGKIFQDVPANKWFAQDVYQAAHNKYMTGAGDGNVFLPYDNLTRGQAAVIIARMAGVNTSGALDNGTVGDNNPTYKSFSDVAPDAFYAKAVSWCANAGIVKGYSGSDVFGPNDPVTRAQFATMLARYAKVVGNYEAADADVLAAYTDAAQVGGWAKESVAWAVEADIMGQNTTVLNPNGNISRAQCAAMVVRYQPKPFSGPLNIA